MSAEFAVCRSQVEEWTKLASIPFRLLGHDEQERRLDLISTVGAHSFFIICPAIHSDGKWQVWSDDEESLQLLADIQDFTDHCNRSLTDVLNQAAKLLFTSSTTTDDSDKDSDEGMEDDEEDDDAYGMDDDDYYGGESIDDTTESSLQPAARAAAAKDDEEGISADDFFTGDGSPAAAHRLILDLKNLNKSKGAFGVEGQPNGDNLFHWTVTLKDFDKDSLLYRDLQSYAKKYNRKPVVHMEMKFPKDYPMNPPFVRVIRPRFKFLTGHVTIGGSVCMQLLTRSGWRPTTDIESMLIQVRAEIMSDKRAQLDTYPDREYNETEARQAFERMVRRYGWNK
ncbi:ubiquitin-conjugating enzyme E2 Q1-like [Corticium candelabrum]|uniref:ubiquitin-conjugating enzyme E2 Q1-like n=1 Tax=Corticium candelabrum TaxID=121492 RepID=UPI002E25D89B|nr:ubiquitin-conjugating enzyme E2 Q1-like [Corticium candelabrum]